MLIESAGARSGLLGLFLLIAACPLPGLFFSIESRQVSLAPFPACSFLVGPCCAVNFYERPSKQLTWVRI